MIAPGATVSEGQAVMELETDKAVVEVPSSISGTVAEILVKEGDKIKVGQVVFTADNGASGAAVKESPRQEEPAKRAEKAQAVQASSGSSSSTPSSASSSASSTSVRRRWRRDRSPLVPRNQNLSRLRNERDRPTRRRPKSFGYRNLGKTFRRAIWCV